MGPIGQRLEAALDELRELFRSRGVILGYVFGSVAADREHRESDLDIAVLFGPDVARDRYFDLMVEINSEIIGLTHTNDVDVVVLNTAPPLLAFEVVANGRLLYGDDGERVAFEVAAIWRFIDTEPIRRVQRDAFFARMREPAQPSADGKGRP